MKEIKKQVKETIAIAEQRAYNNGFDDGMEAASNSYEVRNEFFEDGIRAERLRIINLFKMLSAQELSQGSGTKAKHFKEVVDLIKVADMLEDAEEFVEDEF